MKRIGQGGFATLEVILMVTVIGILASIAVPRFNDITTRANTAKIQADLTAIDTAIAVYNMSESTALSTSSDLSSLNKYLNDAGKLTPPDSGKCYILNSGGTESTAESIPSGGYHFVDGTDGGNVRAALGTHTSGDFVYKPAAGGGGT